MIAVGGAGPTRRDVLRGGLTSGAAALAVTSVSAPAAAAPREAPSEVTLSDDDALLAKYQPQLVLEGVEPRPLAFYGLHAESTESTLNAVYGFVQYPFQEGLARQDSHLGDHEPIIVWYDQTTGDVERVDYAAYHWFRGTRSGDALHFADDDRHRPLFRVDPTYHHYYDYRGDLPGEQIERRSLLEAIDSWLANGLEDDLAPSQPFDPYAMLSRPTWWKHTTGNWFNATLSALWFNLGLSDATSTADVQEVSAW